MAGYNVARDAEKLFAFLDYSHEVNVGNGKMYTSWRSVSAVELRDKWRWTLSRAQATIDYLIAAGRIQPIGFRLNLSDFRKNEKTYQRVASFVERRHFTDGDKAQLARRLMDRYEPGIK